MLQVSSYGIKYVEKSFGTPIGGGVLTPSNPHQYATDVNSVYSGHYVYLRRQHHQSQYIGIVDGASDVTVQANMFM